MTSLAIVTFGHYVLGVLITVGVILFLLTFRQHSDGESDITDEPPTLDTRSHGDGR